jgi:hypothetical protein
MAAVFEISRHTASSLKREREKKKQMQHMKKPVKNPDDKLVVLYAKHVDEHGMAVVHRLWVRAGMRFFQQIACDESSFEELLDKMDHELEKIENGNLDAYKTLIHVLNHAIRYAEGMNRNIIANEEEKEALLKQLDEHLFRRKQN